MNLRDKLRAISQPAAAAPPPAPCGTCWKRDTLLPLSGFPGAPDARTGFIRLMQAEAVPDGLDPRRILYLDTETTGLSGGAGTVAFLTGVGWLQDDGFLVRQYIMRDYPEERWLLAALAEDAARFDVICTFNGKTFDLPLLRSRFLMNRMSGACLDKPQIDLLQIARRVWKLRLGRCSLSALEQAILHQGRDHDLPGAQVPERYFRYLKTRDFSLLEDVLRHNLQDISSLCQLLTHVIALYETPEKGAASEDLYAMGHALERMKLPQEARRYWALCTEGSMRSASQLRLAQSWRREGRRQEAVRIWQAMAARHQGGIRPLVELAKHYEHVERDLPRALRCTEEALMLLAEPGLFDPGAVQEAQNELQYRRARLLRLCGQEEDES